MKAFVIAGPARVGNVFGVYGLTIPEGRFAVVTRGQYANGGCGPSLCVGQLFESAAQAERVAAAFDPDLSDAEVLARAAG